MHVVKMKEQLLSIMIPVLFLKFPLQGLAILQTKQPFKNYFRYMPLLITSLQAQLS